MNIPNGGKEVERPNESIYLSFNVTRNNFLRTCSNTKLARLNLSVQRTYFRTLSVDTAKKLAILPHISIKRNGKWLQADASAVTLEEEAKHIWRETNPDNAFAD